MKQNAGAKKDGRQDIAISMKPSTERTRTTEHQHQPAYPLRQPRLPFDDDSEVSR